MEPYIRHIRINKVRHLHDIDIPVKDTTNPIEGRPVHVMLTGRNGAGKTSVLNDILHSLEYCDFRTSLREQNLQTTSECRCPVLLEFDSNDATAEDLHKKKVLLAYYAPNRRPNFKQPRIPRLHDLGPTEYVDEKRSEIFLDFLLNLKIRRSLVRDEGKDAEAESIDAWFQSFTDILRTIYDDTSLRLDFNGRNYHFTIISKCKESPMDHLPDGYAALLDIIADLILKMQTPDSLVGAFEMPGIVLIDEVETHLHLELQKRVMPMLTQFFPKIQFIVTTHSPFVVSSIPNAVVVDLETGECMDDLDEYPYNSLAEGFFGVSPQSQLIQSRFDRLKKLAEVPDKTESQWAEARKLLADFQIASKFPNPDLRAAIEQLKYEYELR